MNNKLTVVVALVAGLAGGLLTRYIAPPPVFAQALTIRPSIPAPAAGTPVTDELRARSFMLVDQFDHAVGSFTAEPTRRCGSLADHTSGCQWESDLDRWRKRYPTRCGEFKVADTEFHPISLPEKGGIGARPHFCHNDNSCSRNPAYAASLNAS